MDLPPVPARVSALVASGKLPPEFAGHFTPAGELSDGTHWFDVAGAVDEYLAAGGVLWRYSDHLRGLAAEISDENAAMDAYVAEHGATPRGRLEARLTQAHGLYAAGDHTAALVLFREVAEISPWDSEFSGCLDRIDVGWCRLLHDTATVDGPEAARKLWQEARAHYRAARFPTTHHAWPLIEMLLGTGVPDIIEVMIYGWLEAADQDGRSDIPVDEEVHHIFQLALAEIEGSALMATRCSMRSGPATVSSSNPTLQKRHSSPSRSTIILGPRRLSKPRATMIRLADCTVSLSPTTGESPRRHRLPAHRSR